MIMFGLSLVVAVAATLAVPSDRLAFGLFTYG